MDNKITFADGMLVKKIGDDFFAISIKWDEFAKFGYEHSKNGWVNLNLCKSKKNENFYVKLNEWQPKDKNDLSEEIPF